MTLIRALLIKEILKDFNNHSPFSILHSQFVSIQFCCDKWRLSEATGNDLSVTDFVGDSSPERGAKRKTERQPWLPFQGSCQPLGWLRGRPPQPAKSLFVAELNSYEIRKDFHIHSPFSIFHSPFNQIPCSILLWTLILAALEPAAVLVYNLNVE